MDTNTTKIGYISACIAGDHRYTSRIDVFIEGTVQGRIVEGTKVHVILSENGAVGGMDGPGGSYGFSETRRTTVEANSTEIVKAVKAMIKSEKPSVIGTYGKPTKNFVWVGVKERGLAGRLAIAALSFLDE